MRFKVYNEVFEKLPDLSFGVVVGNQINNEQNIPEIYDLMKNEIPAFLNRQLKIKARLFAL